MGLLCLSSPRLEEEPAQNRRPQEARGRALMVAAERNSYSGLRQVTYVWCAGESCEPHGGKQGVAVVKEMAFSC